MYQFKKSWLRMGTFIVLAVASSLLFSCSDTGSKTEADTDSANVETVVPAATPLSADSINAIHPATADTVTNKTITDSVNKKKLRRRPETQNTTPAPTQQSNQ